MAAESSVRGRHGKDEEDVDDLLKRLELHEDDGDDFVWEEVLELPDEKAKWLAIARVHTIKVSVHLRFMWICDLLGTLHNEFAGGSSRRTCLQSNSDA